MVAVPSLNPVTKRVAPQSRTVSPLTDAISGAEDDHEKRPGSCTELYSQVPSAASAPAFVSNRVPRRPMVRSGGRTQIESTTVSGPDGATVSGAVGPTGAARSPPHPHRRPATETRPPRARPPLCEAGSHPRPSGPPVAEGELGGEARDDAHRQKQRRGRRAEGTRTVHPPHPPKTSDRNALAAGTTAALRGRIIWRMAWSWH